MDKKNELMEFDEKYNKIVVGVDEAGRGPLAGPVVAGAIIVIQDFPNCDSGFPRIAGD